MDFGAFFGTPFAESGDKVAIPVESQPSNAVSFTSGYTQDYALNITTDPRAKSIGRTGQNYLFWAITAALGGLQRFGAPSWVGPDDNGGVPLAYPKGARVQQGNVFYVSLVANNTRALTDSTAWAVATFTQASNAEALTGVATDLLLTPANLRYVLQNTSIGQQATTTTAGVTRYATASETQAGAVGNAAVTPQGLKPALDTKANTLNPAFLGPISIQPAGANFGALELLRRTSGDTPGTKAFDYTLQTDGSMRISAYDAAGTNGVAVVTVSPHNASVLETSLSAGGDLAAGRNVIAAGRVQAGTLANEATSSTTRLATAAEMTAGASGVAASPARVTAWASAQFLPIANPRVTGSMRVSGIEGGIEFYNPTGNVPLFYCDSMANSNTRFIFKAVSDAPAVTRNAYEVERATGRVTFPNGITVPAGQSIIAPAPTYTTPSVIRMATQSEVNASTLSEVAISPTTLSNFLSGRFLPTSGGAISGVLAVRANNTNSIVWRDDGLNARFGVATDGNVWALNHFSPTGDYDGTPFSVNFTSGEVAAGTFRANTILGGIVRTTSRRDKKDIIGVLDGCTALDRLGQYTAYLGRWKDDALGPNTNTDVRPFFIADEVAEHAPEVVHFGSDGEAAAVGYSDEMPTVIAAINHLRKLCEIQGKEIERLQSIIDKRG